ncbi:hypothetical protein BASA81_006641 [Batrachochytrium salamandrivorans]|nr:hypothetical protein BASA81_006641 [Batrachochytrium salamandrivorans]
MKPFAKPGEKPQDDGFLPSPSSSKNWDFPKSSPQTPPLSAPAPPFLLGGGGKKFDFSSKPSPSAAPAAQPVAAPVGDRPPSRPIHAAFSRASWSEPSVASDAAPAPQQRRSFPATAAITTTTALTSAKPADTFSKRPRVQQAPPPPQGSPDPQPRAPQRSLVVAAAKPPSHHLSSSLYQHDEPFLEVSNVIQTQTRKIKELETQLREHGFLNEQLRAKLEAGQEASKQSRGRFPTSPSNSQGRKSLWSTRTTTSPCSRSNLELWSTTERG